MKNLNGTIVTAIFTLALVFTGQHSTSTVFSGEPKSSAIADSSAKKSSLKIDPDQPILGTWKIRAIHSSGTIVMEEKQKVEADLTDLQGENFIRINKDSTFELSITDPRTNAETSPKATKGEATWKGNGKKATVKFKDPEKDKAYKITVQMKSDSTAECRCATKNEVSMIGLKMKIDLQDIYECVR
jgi:hypothetical protein